MSYSSGYLKSASSIRYLPPCSTVYPPYPVSLTSEYTTLTTEGLTKGPVHGQWTEEETRQSSTWQELKAVRLVLESFGYQLQNARVWWFRQPECSDSDPHRSVRNAKGLLLHFYFNSKLFSAWSLNGSLGNTTRLQITIAG